MDAGSSATHTPTVLPPSPPPRAGRARRAESHPSPCPRAARYGTHGHSRSEVHTTRTTTQVRSGMGRHSTHCAAHPHLPVDVPTSPSAGKTGRVGSANHNGNRGRCRNARHPADSGNRLAPATQHRAPPTRAVPCPPRCTTSTSTMATTTGACHVDNPPPPGRAPATDQRRPTVYDKAEDDQQRPTPTRSTVSGQPETTNSQGWDTTTATSPQRTAP